MTIYGGEATTWGTRNGGFFVSCTKCGWHSKVRVYHKDEIGFKSIVFECDKCHNKYEMEIE